MFIMGAGVYVLGPCMQPAQQLSAVAMPCVRVGGWKAIFPICTSYSDYLQLFEEIPKIFVKEVQNL